MNERLHLREFGSMLAAAALALAALAAPSAASTCSYTALASKVPVGAFSTPSYFSIEQPENYWMGVGVRSAPGDDWDILLYDTTAASPGCVAGLLAGSGAFTGVDFVVGDYNFYLPQDFPRDEYAVVTRFSGTADAIVEWDDDDDGHNVNRAPVLGSMGANDVLDVWDMYMYAGLEHTIIFDRVGTSTLTLLVFENPGASPYWAGRSARALEITADTTATYTPSLSGYHGIVVVNEDGAVVDYSVEVRVCSPPVALLNDGSAFGIDPGDLYWYSIAPQVASWQAVAIRPDQGTDWDLSAYANGSGGTWPVCLSGLLGTSPFGVGAVDVVVGDYNHIALGTDYIRPYVFSGSGIAVVQWAEPPGLLTLNAPLVNGSFVGGQVVDAWEVDLISGVTY
ncbi:MAG: hypothetical protein L0206_25965, partial [Actinobacteria bacterium]|nr:hypothetical protein [Actinomycetota bacterium]